jgi:Cu(I)/Ag(I) efflux system membrane fusion protein/cobalt-zinc-cadmium efflux system membrane fusion protein
MKIRTYQLALGVAVAACVILAAALAWALRDRIHLSHSAAQQDPVIARGPAANENTPQPDTPPADHSDPALAPVQLSPQRMQSIGVTFATAELKPVSQKLQVPGNVDIDEQNISYVQTRFPGWVQDVFVNATYQYVRKGQPLFTVYSPDLVSSEQEYLLARQNQKAFSQDMHDDMHGMPAKENNWLIQAAEQRLQHFGVAPSDIAQLESTGKVQRNITIDSPASGYITERNALPNAYVQPEMKLYTIADLGTVWVYANVFQNDVGRLKRGDPAGVTVDAYPGRTFRGRIDQVLPQVDPATRTVRVRLVLANPGLLLKPGMYVNVDVSAQLGRQLVVPASAVLQSGERAIAFIDHGEGNLEPRVVAVGPQIDDSIVVLSGLKPGDRVVSSANFLIDSEAQLQAAFQNFTPAAPPASAKENQEKIEIAFSTDPAAPHKGSNIVHVRLSGADGKPITGVQPEVVFFMPAMPQMGMAAERATATLVEKGNGQYEGPLQLPSGGTFQVTVTVKRAGQVIATKQLSVNATGGM